MRLVSLLPKWGTGAFQFTHPGRGATGRLSVSVLRHSVSIHAPREGCDVSGSLWLATSSSFQFTHPGRGATFYVEQLHYLAAVSIHAPREGCDDRILGHSGSIRLFQFTHPGRGATSSFFILRISFVFQFTHPGRGATVEDSEVATWKPVSIHAPREGCDRYYDSGGECYPRFNSRTPGGVRHRVIIIGRGFRWFQFTHPGRGATVWCKVAYYGADKQA